jgi:hypothetical protein
VEQPIRGHQTCTEFIFHRLQISSTLSSIFLKVVMMIGVVEQAIEPWSSAVLTNRFEPKPRACGAKWTKSENKVAARPELCSQMQRCLSLLTWLEFLSFDGARCRLVKTSSSCRFRVFLAFTVRAERPPYFLIWDLRDLHLALHKLLAWSAPPVLTVGFQNRFRTA